jgi:hypothetical protein
MLQRNENNERITAGNKQFGVMAGERLRLNVFGKLKVRSSIEVYRLKSATNAKLPKR